MGDGEWGDIWTSLYHFEFFMFFFLFFSFFFFFLVEGFGDWRLGLRRELGM